MDDVIRDTLYFVAQKGWAESRTGFFTALVEFLGKALKVEYALVDELLADGKTARTVGLFASGGIAPNLEYSLAGTPCERVIGKTLCYFPRNIQELFPKDALLVDMGAESYVGIPLWSSKGAPVGLIAVMGKQALDPALRHQTEAVLQVVAVRCAHELEALRNESRLLEYRALLHDSPDGFWLADSQGRLRDVNQAYCKLSGYTAHELLALSVTELEAVERPAEVRAHVARIIAKGSDRFRSQHRRKDGTVFDVEVSAQYWPADGGRFAVHLRDITAELAAEREHARVQEQLQQAQKMEAIGRLAGGVAHDFNNMLGVILGHAELAIEQTDRSAPILDDLIEIRDAAARSAGLTRQLLGFARKQTIVPQVLELNATLEGMLKMLRRLLGEDLELTWLPGPTVARINMDPSQLNQILTNLCLNARDAITGPGKISIRTCGAVFDDEHCETHPAHRPGRYFAIAVTDSGSGIDQENLAKLFEPFFTTKGLEKGAGLGLATVYGIVQQNEGFIDVESAVGKGSTFTVYLPAHDAPLAQAAPPAERRAPRGSELVLVVEDEPVLKAVVAKMLRGLGYGVLEAGEPEKAERLLREQGARIRLLLTDVVMPQLNGRDLALRLQAIQPGLKCVYMSGYAADVVALRGIVDDGVNFIQKPFTPAELGAKVRAALDG